MEKLILSGLTAFETSFYCPKARTPITLSTEAALAGGFTALIGPDGQERFSRYPGLGNYIDVGFYASAIPQKVSTLIGENNFFAFTFNSQDFAQLSSAERLEVFKATMESMNPDKPLILSARELVLEKAVRWATTYSRRLHIHQVTTASQIEIISKAKEINPRITSDTTIYQLFLDKDREKELQIHGMAGLPLPTLADQEALWNAIKSGVIDMISTGLTPLGTLGAELTLPLLLRAASEGRIQYSGERGILDLLRYQPEKIFGALHQATTPAYACIDPKGVYALDHTQLITPCSWTPFDGLQIVGKVDQVVLGVTIEGKYRKGEYTESEPRVIFKNGEVKHRSAGGFLLPSRKGASEHDLGVDISGISPSLQDPNDFTPPAYTGAYAKITGEESF